MLIHIPAWLVPTIEKFPKNHKFTVGDRIQIIALDVLEALIEAAHEHAAPCFRESGVGAKASTAPKRKRPVST